LSEFLHTFVINIFMPSSHSSTLPPSTPLHHHSWSSPSWVIWLQELLLHVLHLCCHSISRAVNVSVFLWESRMFPTFVNQHHVLWRSAVTSKDSS
jgi:hypothetical protein